MESRRQWKLEGIIEVATESKPMRTGFHRQGKGWSKWKREVLDARVIFDLVTGVMEGDGARKEGHS